jgi:Tol biopolymer transport system component
MGFGSELWSARENGQSPARVVVDEASIIAFARPSPTGELVAFIKIPDSETPFSNGELWVVDEENGEGKMLAEADAGHGYAAAWSPDGSQLAFVVRSNPEDPRADTSIEALKSNIAVVEVASGETALVTRFEQGRATSPTWSPDGNTLAFGYVLDGRMNVLIADPTGRQATTVIIEDACCPAWMRK